MAAHRNTPFVKYGILEVRTDVGEVLEKIMVGSDRWFEWLSDDHHFYFKNNLGKFTARKEERRNTFYWYAYRKINGQLKKKYLGASAKLTDKNLYDTAKWFGL